MYCLFYAVIHDRIEYGGETKTGHTTKICSGSRLGKCLQAIEDHIEVS